MEDRERMLMLEIINWMRVFNVYSEGNRFIIRGNFYPGVDFEVMKRRLNRYARYVRIHQGTDHDILEVELKKQRFHIPRINLILFILTIFTTLLAGTLMAGYNPFRNPLFLYKGVPFSASLMLILGCHELGHFLMAKKHGVDATLPYFIPAPTFIGTFGAFIRIRSPIQHRAALVEIGAAGPIAGFIVALPALFIGLSLSDVVYNLPDTGLRLGESLMMKIATSIMFPNLPEGADIVLHPIGFAAWIGMIVTMLNLIPIGQLDGGHIAYALLGKSYIKVAWSAFFALLVLGIFSVNWLVWAALVFFLIRVKHPPVLDYYRPLSLKEILIGIVALVIFILTFVPVPFRI